MVIQVMAPSHGVVLKSNHLLVGYIHNFWATIVLAYLAGSAQLQIEGLWLIWCLDFSENMQSMFL